MNSKSLSLTFFLFKNLILITKLAITLIAKTPKKLLLNKICKKLFLKNLSLYRLILNISK